jgi:hypothetical protein
MIRRITIDIGVRPSAPHFLPGQLKPAFVFGSRLDAGADSRKPC